MKTKLQTVSVLGIVLWLVILGVIGYKAQNGGYGGLLAMLPKQGHVTGCSATALEDIHESPLMLTYENISEAVTVVNDRNYTVTMYGVNYAYPYVMRYPMLNGGFFTQETQENKKTLAVLNETAAFEIFGGIDITGQKLMLRQNAAQGTNSAKAPAGQGTYIVAGVINDGDADNKNLYVPLTLLDKTADAVMTAMDGRASEEFIINKYKPIGITDMNYDIYNLDAMGKTISDKLYLGAAVAIIAFLLAGLYKGVKVLQNYRADMKNEANIHGEQNQNDTVRTKRWIKLCAAAVVTLEIIILTAVVSEKALALVLHWYRYPSVRPWAGAAFYTKMSALHTLGIVSDGCFLGLCLTALLFLLVSVTKER